MTPLPLKTDWFDWLYDSSDNALMVVVSVVLIFLVLGICTRFGRLRSLSQMSGFDFGVNVAVGSILGAVALSPDPSLFRAALALASIFALQIGWSWTRRNLPTLSNPSSQPPQVVWANGGFVEAGMKKSLFTQSDIYQAIRTSGMRRLDEVGFVVAEQTGTLTVYGKKEGGVSEELFAAVEGSKLLG